MSLRRQRGELERATLDVLWDHGGWLTPAEVGERLDADLAYTTVVTVLTRMYDKDLVVREKDGRAYAYSALRTRDQQAAVAMSELLEGARDSTLALNHFVENLDEDNRRQLIRMLRRRT
jgi:predicted transcriptional regulator